MIHRRIDNLNPSLTSIDVGDFIAVTIQYRSFFIFFNLFIFRLNPRATEKHKSRHEVTSLEKIDLPPSIRKVYTADWKGNIVAIIQAVVQARKNGILTNEFIGIHVFFTVLTIAYRKDYRPL